MKGREKGLKVNLLFICTMILKILWISFEESIHSGCPSLVLPTLVCVFNTATLATEKKTGLIVADYRG